MNNCDVYTTFPIQIRQGCMTRSGEVISETWLPAPATGSSMRNRSRKGLRPLPEGLFLLRSHAMPGVSRPGPGAGGKGSSGGNLSEKITEYPISAPD
jgi:hypothetical protein